jgi:hypothetical protein
MHNINIFISHSWNYENHYETLAEWIFKEDWKLRASGMKIKFNDYSIPKNNPIHNARNSEDLKNAIYAEITKSHIVVIPMGMYASHSNWIQKEIDGANYYRRPILAVNPWAQERKSSVVANAAAEKVGWNKQSVIDAIWGLYRKNYGQ